MSFSLKTGIPILVFVLLLAFSEVRIVSAQPSAQTISASDITATSAVLYGMVVPNGQDTVYQFVVDYKDPFLHVQDCPAGAGGRVGGSVPVPVTCQLTGLKPSTTYTFALAVCWHDWSMVVSGLCVTAEFLDFTTAATQSQPGQTDYALSNPSLSPAQPKVGDQVQFSAVLTALSSNFGYPQTVQLTLALDEGGSPYSTTYDYAGPTGKPVTVTIPYAWTATSGSHTIMWSVEPTGIVTDPDKSNNHISLPFSVGTVNTVSSTTTMAIITPTTTTSSILTTVTTSVPPSTTMSSSQTTTSSESSTTSSVSTVTPVGSSITEIIQQNPLIVLVVIALILLAVLALRRRPSEPTPVAQPSANVVYCRKCGNQNPTTNQFCRKCGAKLG